MLGYYAAHLLWSDPDVAMPHLVGNSLYSAMVTVSAYPLYPRIVEYYAHAHLPQGTIIEQSPQPGQSIKRHQTVYVGVSFQPEQPETPSLVNEMYEHACTKAKTLGVHLRAYQLPSTYPAGMIMAQIPRPGEALSRTIIVYVAQPKARWLIMPDWCGSDASDIQQICHQYHVPITVFTKRGERVTQEIAPHTYTVVHQRPMPGAFIDASCPPLVQLVVTDAT